MTLAVFENTSDRKWPTEVFNMKEANAARDGGNEITVRANEFRNGIHITLKNDDFSVDITHKTATMLLYALLDNAYAEYSVCEIIAGKLRYGRSNYPNAWQNLEDVGKIKY